MAEPARKPPRDESRKLDFGLEGDEAGINVLLRWVERPDGRMELLRLPLTPELFLNPQLEDNMVQGGPHGRVRGYFFEMLSRRFQSEKDVLVFEDMQHRLGPGLPTPAPDVSVIRGARNPDTDLSFYDVVEQGVAPCLVIEVVSPSKARIRRVDEVDKVELYQRVGVREYLLVGLPRRATGYRFRIKEYRLGPERRYRPIEPDDQGCLLSETTGLRFGVAPDGNWIEMFDAKTGERLLTPLEIEERAAREAEARKVAEEALKAAEEELTRLRAELERLKKSSRF
ncbi:MAG TPA: Uma2 family endonuclease [Thermoanaerobaculia bacterium]